MLNDKARILLVDDNVDFTYIFCEYIKIFEIAGLELIGIAKNGLEAIDMVILEQPDIVLLDIIMPQLDGLGVLNKLNGMNLRRKPSIIMLSAAGESAKIQSCLDLGALLYFEKPFDMNVLIYKLIELKTSKYAND